MTKDFELINECIACGSKDDLVPLLDLGIQPLANSYVKDPNESELMFPLATNLCKNCFHVQLTGKVNPDLLFKNYLYVSGTAKTQLDYFDWFARFVVENQSTVLSVLDIGCNDGSQLNSFLKFSAKQDDRYLRLKILTNGVDPATNLFNISSEKHNVYCGYFDTDYANVHENQHDVLICQNAFAHNYNQLMFLKNMARVVRRDGFIYITTSQADMILKGEFDTIYHEHLSFFSVLSMSQLCERAGLYIHEVLKHPIHGTSFIFVLTKNEERRRDNYLDLIIEQEKASGLYDENIYTAYKYECQEIINDFSTYTHKLSNSGVTVVGYGAPAKGNTLLNASKAKLDFIIDDNPLKQGLYTPGTHIPIYSSKKLEEYKDVESLVFVPLAWNFFDEIRAKIKKTRPDKKDLFLRTYPYIHEES